MNVHSIRSFNIHSLKHTRKKTEKIGLCSLYLIHSPSLSISILQFSHSVFRCWCYLLLLLLLRPSVRSFVRSFISFQILFYVLVFLLFLPHFSFALRTTLECILLGRICCCCRCCRCHWCRFFAAVAAFLFPSLILSLSVFKANTYYIQFALVAFALLFVDNFCSIRFDGDGECFFLSSSHFGMLFASSALALLARFSMPTLCVHIVHFKRQASKRDISTYFSVDGKITLFAYTAAAAAVVALWAHENIVRETTLYGVYTLHQKLLFVFIK